MTSMALVEKVKDPELAVWLSEEAGEAREILVDAVLPKRVVLFRQQASGRLSPSDLEPGSSPQGRREVLSKLRTILERVLDTPPVVLESAGALAIRASSRQVREFVDHPLVKAVRPNRRLHPPVWKP